MGRQEEGLIRIGKRDRAYTVHRLVYTGYGRSLSECTSECKICERGIASLKFSITSFNSFEASLPILLYPW